MFDNNNLISIINHSFHRRKLLSDIDRSEKEVQNYLERLQKRFFKLHDTVRYKTAIPSTEVYVRNHFIYFLFLRIFLL